MANKKITELPLINALSGSQIGGTVLPAVVGGTTNQISIENFSKFVNAYNAHTGSAGNIFSGPQTINNNVTINGRLTVNEVVTQYETASVLFSTGSTKLGDELSDKHEITGSTNITGSLIYNNVLVANIDINTISRLQQATQSLQVASASLQAHSASVDAQLLRLQQTTQSLQVATASLNAFTASQDSRNFTLSLYTASLEAQLQRVYQTTQSLHVATASLNIFTASQDSRNFVISQYTSSTDAHIVGISDFTSSQLAVNLGNAIYTSSVESHIVGISTYTSSVRDTLARIHQATASIQATTASINSFTSSTNAHIVGISTYTSSNESWKDGVRGEVSRIEAWTASLDSLYATDAQLYQLYQATRSIELHSGSMVGITNGLMDYTSSNETWKTGVRGEISAIEAWTASLDSTYATDAQLYQLYAETASMKGEIAGLESYTASLKAASIVSSSTQISNYYKFAETASANTFYSNQKIKGNLDIDNKVSITGSLIVSSSTNQLWATPDFELYNGLGNVNFRLTPNTGNQFQIQAYGTKAEITQPNEPLRLLSPTLQVAKYDNTATKVEITGSLVSNANVQANKFVFTDGVVSQNVGGQNIIGTSGNILYLYTGTSGLYINNQANNAQNVTITDAGVVTTRGALTIGGPGNDQNLTFGGTNSSIYWGAGGPARMYYSTGDIKVSSNGATDVLNVQNIGGISVSGGITGSLMATNGVVSSSQQILNYNTFAVTSSANTFYGNQTLSGSLYIKGTNVIRLYDPADNANYWDTYAYNDGTLRVNFKGAGNDEITVYTDGNLSLEAAITASNFKIKTAGGGVDFSADTGGTGTTTWEILNDYEEGTWTGTMTGTVSNPTTPVTATGYYTKIGRQVTISIIFSNVDTTGASGGVRITGVPFATAYTGGVGSVILENFDFTGTKTSVASYMNAGTPTTIFIEASGDETTFGGVAHSAGTGRYLYTTLTYFT